MAYTSTLASAFSPIDEWPMAGSTPPKIARATSAYRTGARMGRCIRRAPYTRIGTCARWETVSVEDVGTVLADALADRLKLEPAGELEPDLTAGLDGLVVAA